MLNIVSQRLNDVNRPTNGGRATPTDMRRNVKCHALHLHSTLNLTVAGGPAGGVTPDGHQRMITAVRLKENGVTVVEVSGRQLATLSAESVRAAQNIGQLANGNNQTTTLDADFVIRFADIYGADPSETCFVERNPQLPTQIEVEFEPNGNAVGNLLTAPGASTVTINSHVVQVVEEYDDVSTVMPFFLPRIKRFSSQQFSGVRTAFPTLIYPEGFNRVQGLLFHALADNVTTPGIFNGNVTLRGDKKRYWDNVPVAVVLDQYRAHFDQPAPSAGFLRFVFKQYGKLTGAYWATQDQNFRLEADVNGSGTVNILDALSLELESIPGYTRPLPKNF